MPGQVNRSVGRKRLRRSPLNLSARRGVACGAGGAFELNVYIRMMARNLLESFKL